MEIMLNKVKIGWKQYDVVFSESKLNSGAELYGQVNYDSCVITLREEASPDQQRATLIHEMLHAISEMYGLELEEKLVTDLANALFTVYKDNFAKCRTSGLAAGERSEIEENAPMKADKTAGECSHSKDKNWQYKIAIYCEDQPQAITAHGADEYVIIAKRGKDVYMSHRLGSEITKQDLLKVIEKSPF